MQQPKVGQGKQPAPVSIRQLAERLPSHGYQQEAWQNAGRGTAPQLWFATGLLSRLDVLYWAVECSLNSLSLFSNGSGQKEGKSPHFAKPKTLPAMRESP